MEITYLDIEIVAGETLAVYEIINSKEIKLTHDSQLNTAIDELVTIDLYNCSFNFIASSSNTYRKFKIYSPSVLITQKSDKLFFLNSENFNSLILINGIETYIQE